MTAWIDIGSEKKLANAFAKKVVNFGKLFPIWNFNYIKKDRFHVATCMHLFSNNNY